METIAPESTHDTELDVAITEVEQQLAVFLPLIRARWRVLARKLHPDLQPIGYKIVSLLAWGGPLHATQLAEQLATDKSVLSRQAAQLEQLGLIERRSDERDRRIRVLAATPAAIERIEQMRAARHAELRDELAGWPREDISAFADMMRRFSRVI